ncbi:MAG: hypothetical protein ACRDUY_14480 [Nitriliruptorales bacterium]
MDLDLDVHDERVELVRDRTAATFWTLLSGVLLGIVGWLVVDSHGHAASWVLLAAAVVVSAFFVAQLVAPRSIRVTLGPEGIEAASFGRRIEIGWDDVLVARVREVAGERILAVDVRPPDSTGPATRHGMAGMLLPVGADLDLLHAALERRLGRGNDGRPTTTPGT